MDTGLGVYPSLCTLRERDDPVAPCGRHGMEPLGHSVFVMHCIAEGGNWPPK